MIWFGSQRFTRRSSESSGVVTTSAPSVSSHAARTRARSAAAASGAAKRAGEREGVGLVPPLAEHERERPRLARGERDRHVEGGAGVEPAARAPGEARAVRPRRRPERAAGAAELAPVGGAGDEGLARGEERDPLRERGVLGVAGEEGAAVRSEGGHDVARRCRARRAERPLGGREDRETARRVPIGSRA